MGNYFNKCYLEQDNEQLEGNDKRKPLIEEQMNVQDSLPNNQNKQIQQLNLEQNDDPQKYDAPQNKDNIKFHPLQSIEMKEQFQMLQINTDANSILENLQDFCNAQFKIDQLNGEFSKLFNDPFMILSSDLIQEYVSNQFQLQMAIKRYTLGEKYLGELNDQEGFIAEAIQTNLTTELIPLFKYERIQFKNKKIEKLFQGIKIIVLVCDFFGGLLVQNLKQNEYVNNIKIYNLLYNQFQKLILNINSINQQTYNALPTFQTNYQFSLLGYAMRFWCQIVFSNMFNGRTNKNRNILLESFRNVDKKGMEFDIYQYIVGAIDLCCNEYSSNWIGHEDFIIPQQLIDMNHNELNRIEAKDFQSFNIKINKQLQHSRQYYPTWIFKKNQSRYSLDLKIKELMKEIKKSLSILSDSELSIQTYSGNQQKIYLSYDNQSTGYGLFDENEKGDKIENQMKIMTKFLMIDQNVQPKSDDPQAQRPSHSFQPFSQFQIEKIYPKSFPLDILDKQKNQEINEKVKKIKPEYFVHLNKIRLEYKVVSLDIRMRNFKLEKRNNNSNINQKLFQEKQDIYNFQKPQITTNNELKQFIKNKQNQDEIKRYDEIKNQIVKNVRILV